MAEKGDRLTECKAWKQLEEHYEVMKDTHMRKLFEDDPKRFEKFSFEFLEDRFLLDYSKNRITTETLDLLLALAEERGVADLRESMFRGEKINFTESRAVLHTALRYRGTDPVIVDGKDVMPDVNATLAKVPAPYYLSGWKRLAWTSRPARLVLDRRVLFRGQQFELTRQTARALGK